jgi:quercetin dioxygenase-like cupin family protein
MRAWLLAALLAGSAAAQAPPPGTIQLPADRIEWKPGSPTMPPGTQVAVLEGDPKSAAFFTLRLKVPAGARLPPHWHPRDERVTVLSGKVAVGFGDTVEESRVTTYGAGSFYLSPARSHHYVLFLEDTVLQATGVGPWEVNLLKPSAPAR